MGRGAYGRRKYRHVGLKISKDRILFEFSVSLYSRLRSLSFPPAKNLGRRTEDLHMHDISQLALASATVLEKRSARKVQDKVASIERLPRSTKIKAFIIHLDRARQRAPQVGRLMADLPVVAEVIEAIDGNGLTE